MKRLVVFLLPLDGLLVHRRSHPCKVSPTIRRYPFIHLGGERHCESKVSCPKNRARTRTGPLTPESSALTIRPPCLGLVVDKICRCSTLPRVRLPPHRSMNVLRCQKAVTAIKTATANWWLGAHANVSRASRTRTSNWTTAVMGKRQRSSTSRLTGKSVAVRSRIIIATARIRPKSVQRYGK